MASIPSGPSGTQSTPQSVGMNRIAEYNEDTRATAELNLRLIKRDLEKKNTAHIIHFLKGLLCLMLTEMTGKDVEDVETHTEMEAIFHEMLNAAVSFCNDDTCDERKELDEHLKTYCSHNIEPNRYRPLSGALNVISKHFRGRAFGIIPKPEEREYNEEVVFMPNDPEAIISEYIYDDSLRKPDIIGVFVPFMQEKYDKLKDYDFDMMARGIADGNINSAGLDGTYEDDDDYEVDSPIRKSASRRAAKKKGKKKARKAAKKLENRMKWINVHQTWELKIGSVPLKVPKKKKWTIDEVKQLYDDGSEPPRFKGKKRVHNSSVKGSKHTNGRPNKRQRREVPVAFSSIVKHLDSSTKDAELKVDPITQCAYYGLERLSAAWFITHSIVVLLSGADLSIRWFDAEGCVESKSFDFLQELPVFVLTIMIFQRFTPFMWGLSQRDESSVIVGGETFFLAEEKHKFQLFGRRSFATSASSSDPTVSSNSTDGLSTDGTLVGEEDTEPQELPILRRSSRLNDKLTSHLHQTEHPTPLPQANAKPNSKCFTTYPYYYKCSWAESTRIKEPVIVTTIHQRAKSLLPGDYCKMVTNHVPKVVASECSLVSTAPLRLAIKVAGGLAERSTVDIKNRARVRVLLITRRLRPIYDLEPTDFWKVFWDINRCSYLSWKIGIAQGDISLGNMMYDVRDGEKIGILNDYDLAAIMEPGDRYPRQTGWERTGTIPFMAIDILDNPNGELKRWYRHDLEASAWCLAYHMLNERPKEWLGHDFSAVANAKGLFLIKASGKDYKEEWTPYTEFLFIWMRKWSDVQATRPSSLAGKSEDAKKAAQQQDENTGDSTYIETATHAARSLKGVKLIDALSDTSWINVKLRTSVEVQ